MSTSTLYTGSMADRAALGRPGALEWMRAQLLLARRRWAAQRSARKARAAADELRRRARSYEQTSAGFAADLHAAAGSEVEHGL